MEAIFWLVFGAVVGTAALPYLPGVIDPARRRLGELDRSRDPSPWS